MARHIFRIELTPAAIEKPRHVSEELGMTQISIMSKLVEWFAGSEDSIQKGVLSVYPKGYEIEVARMILERIAKGG